MKKSRFKGSTIAALFLVSAMALLSACASAGNKEGTNTLPKLNEGESATLKVTYWDENSFYQNFGNLFIAQYPNIDFEIVSTSSVYTVDGSTNPEEAYMKLVKEQQPDILLLNSFLFKPLYEEGLLYELDAVIEQDNEFSLEGVLPGAIRKMRRQCEFEEYWCRMGVRKIYEFRHDGEDYVSRSDPRRFTGSNGIHKE